jgi:hypothetical protein
MTNPLPRLPLFYLPDLFPHLSDLTRASGSWLATLSIGLAVGLPGGAAADPVDADEAPKPSWARWLDPDAEHPPGMGENFYYRKGSGLEYRRDAKLGSNSVEVGIQGPLLRKKKDPNGSNGFAEPGRSTKRASGVGLAVEVRF